MPLSGLSLITAEPLPPTLHSLIASEGLDAFSRTKRKAETEGLISPEPIQPLGLYPVSLINVMMMFT
jgi:hypothetical protein